MKHVISLFKESDWDLFKKNKIFIRNPYDFRKSEIIPFEEGRNLVINLLKKSEQKHLEDQKAYNSAYKRLQKDDNFLIKVVNKYWALEDILGEPFRGALDDLDIYAYDRAFGDSSEFWIDSGNNDFIDNKYGVVIISGTIG